MPPKPAKNTIHLILKIAENCDKTFSFKYLCRLDNGVEVALEGIKITKKTNITVELHELTRLHYKMTQCLLPCGQDTVTGELKEVDGNYQAIITDTDKKIEPQNYNFVIVAKCRVTSREVVCDPQIRNRGNL